MAAKQDPYTKPDTVSTQDKVTDLLKIVDGVGASMLTTRAHDSNHLHSRAMYPYSHKGLTFSYLANAECGKFPAMKKDAEVNVSFYSKADSSWVSIAGTANIVDDRERIKRDFRTDFKAWFADMGDGVRTGDGNDPRVQIIDVVPDEIRYYIETMTTVGKMVEIASSIVSDDTAKPGDLRILTGNELEQAKKLVTE